jgi:hypothetical protein
VCGPLRSLNVAVAAAVLFYEVTGRALRQGVLSAIADPETSPCSFGTFVVYAAAGFV